MNKIEILNKKLKIMYKYKIACNLIDWDLLTNANDSTVDEMINTQAMFKTRILKLKTSEEFGGLLEELLKEKEYSRLTELEKMTVRSLKKDYDEYKGVPVKFYTKYEKLLSKSQNVWAVAKRKNDFQIFKPYLKKVVEMTKKMTVYRKGTGENIYDLMLSDYEEGLNTKIADELFEEIKNYAVKTIKKIEAGKKLKLKKISENKEVRAEEEKIKYPIEKQKEISRYLLEYIGFDTEKGTMGESEHPFTMSIALGDTRLTNHYYEYDFINPMFSIIHEGGHGIFEQNIDEKYRYTPMEDIENMGLHESQSRFYENILGKNINFWKPIFNHIKEILPEYKGEIEEFDNKINEVKLIPIRINSDELSYCLHIIVRYEVEKDLFAGKITVDEIQKVWDEKMNEYLGVCVENPSEGVLQDSHWSGGSFGYFPTYLIGSIYDGMLLERLEKEMGDIDKILAEGEIKKVTKWLNENIHRYGAGRKPMELVEELCGKKITAKPLIKYFKEKYEKE